MTTEDLMVHAIKRGLLITDFHELSIGMILDYINKYDELNTNSNDERANIVKARQDEFNNF